MRNISIQAFQLVFLLLPITDLLSVIHRSSTNKLVYQCIQKSHQLAYYTH